MLELSRFEEQIKLLREAGFNPIVVSVMVCEDVFYFTSKNEAEKAYLHFEGGKNATRQVEGWWYGIEELKENHKSYKNSFGYEPEIIIL